MKQTTKDRLLSIPVIGHAAALAMLPKELRAAQANLSRQREETEELNRAAEMQRRTAEERWQAITGTFDSLGRQIRDLQEQAGTREKAADERWQAITGTFDSLGQQIRDMQEQAGTREKAAEERWQAAAGTFDSLGQQLRDVREQAEERWQAAQDSLEAVKGQLTQEESRKRFDAGIQRLLGDGTALSALRTALSIHPAVWGPADRLHIDAEASVDACLFNTNSGSIRIGRYTFAGPGVSLIAGGHDVRLTDFPRRDLQLTEGCDIDIGQGVWLCANCTVLGPCRIGDHAVIAAGAVVLPGTEVEANCVYAGVPAVKKRELDPEARAEAVTQAMNRLGGCLYTQGWYTAESIRTADGEMTGHWMIREEAEILCGAGERTFRYRSPIGAEDGRKLTVTMNGWRTETDAGASGEIRIPAEAFAGKETGTLRLRIDRLYHPENGDPRSLGLFVG